VIGNEADLSQKLPACADGAPEGGEVQLLVWIVDVVVGQAEAHEHGTTAKASHEGRWR
jgi:hypothetical protein